MSRTFGVDPTLCPKCGATLLVRAVVATWGTAHLLLIEVLGYETLFEVSTRHAPARDSPADFEWAWARSADWAGEPRFVGEVRQSSR